jgi:hypothetical protein
MQNCIQESMWRSWQGRCCCGPGQSRASRVYPALSSSHFDWLDIGKGCARTTVSRWAILIPQALITGQYQAIATVRGEYIDEPGTDPSIEDEKAAVPRMSVFIRLEHEQGFPKGDAT